MKNLILLTILCLIRCGTDQGDITSYTYTLKNESGKNIVIKSYLLDSPYIKPITTNLGVGEELTRTFWTGLDPGERYNFLNFFGDNKGQARDSIKVVYNNLKVSFLRVDFSDNERNPLNKEIYNKTEETFTFLEEDYENAQDCNGNCD